jgi:hypothetical protein
MQVLTYQTAGHHIPKDGNHNFFVVSDNNKHVLPFATDGHSHF